MKAVPFPYSIDGNASLMFLLTSRKSSSLPSAILYYSNKLTQENTETDKGKGYSRSAQNMGNTYISRT